MFIDSLGYDLDNPIEGKKEKIIKYFVDFYGEKYSDLIRQRIENCYVYTLSVMTDYEKEKLNKHFAELKNKALLLPKEERAAAIKKNEEDQQKILDYYKNKQYLKIAHSLPEHEYFMDFLVKNFNVPLDKQERLKKECLGSLEYYVMFDNFPWIKSEQKRELAQSLADVIYDGKPPFGFKLRAKHILSDRNKIAKGVMAKVNEKDNLLRNIIAEDLFKDLPKDLQNIGAIREEILSYLKGEISLYTGAISLSTYREGKQELPIGVIAYFSAFLNDSKSVVHELNHVVAVENEMYNGTLISKNGVRKMELDGQERIKNINEWLDSELVNEIICDYFSEKIVEKMRKDGYEITMDGNTESVYSSLFPLYRNFIENNSEKVKDCYLGKDPYEFKDFIGEQNYDELCRFTHSMFNYCKRCDFRSLPYLAEKGIRLYEVDVDQALMQKPDDKTLDGVSKLYFNLIKEGKHIFDNIEKYISRQREVAQTEAYDENENDMENV